eukprot:2807095-Rhodomonas_salina.1
MDGWVSELLRGHAEVNPKPSQAASPSLLLAVFCRIAMETENCFWVAQSAGGGTGERITGPSSGFKLKPGSLNREHARGGCRKS